MARLQMVCLAMVALATSLSAQTLQFSDQTAAAGVSNDYFTGTYSNSNYPAGGAVADFNNDGWQDLFVTTGGSAGNPDRLFINNGDGTFTDEAVSWGLTTVHYGKGVAVGDFNGDGWVDIYVTSAGLTFGGAPGQHKLYRNNGDNTFTNIATSAGVDFTHPTLQDGWGCTFADYDVDGDLDLFVAGFTNDNAGSKLFQNNGDETFTDVTAAVGLFPPGSPNHRSFAPRMVDMDGDLLPDLLLVSDFGTSVYYRNNGGAFEVYTGPSNTGQEENGMGGNVGDFNRDGLLDWYVSSIYRPSIGWTGNKLYLNQGNHNYSEISNPANCFDGGYGWGCVTVDFDHDGDTDIGETNGGCCSPFSGEQSYLWLNNDDDTFTEVALSVGLEHFDQGRGMVNFDYDNDGDQDVAIMTYNGPLKFFRNDLSGPDINWIRIFLDTTGTGIAPQGLGSKVHITVAGQSQMVSVDGGDNFLSKSEYSAHFGLGAATTIDEISVAWPDGTTTVLTDVPGNQVLTITPVAIPPTTPFRRGDVNNNGSVEALPDALSLLSYGFAAGPVPPCFVGADVNGSNSVDPLPDALTLLNWGFAGGAAPPFPGQVCGEDPTSVDTLGCLAPSCP